MNDKDCSTCLDCRQPFGNLRRRHHCRFCGRIFCDKCTPGKMLQLRSCNKCIQKHDTNHTLTTYQTASLGMGTTLIGPRAIVIAATEPEVSAELGLEKGQWVSLRCWVDENWYLCTTVDNHSGIVPCNFLKVVEELPPTSTLISMRGASTAGASRRGSGRP